MTLDWSRDCFVSGVVACRLSDLLARGDLPTTVLMGPPPPDLMVRSIGALGEAGDDNSDLPTGPMGEHVINLDLCGEFGGRMLEFLRSLGVTGDLSGVYCFSDVAGKLGCLVRGEGWRGE